MSETRRISDNDIISCLRQRKSLAEIRITETQKNLESKVNLENAISYLSNEGKALKERLQECKKTLKATVSYITDKKQNAEQGIYNAIYEASQIIPGCPNVKLVIKDKKASLEDNEGRDMNLCQASSWKATTSVLTREAVLSNTEFMQDMILDEPLSVLDDYSSADFSMRLPLLAKDRLIILIEQKDSIFSNADVMTYKFDLLGDVTEVTCINGDTQSCEGDRD